jgi:alanine racemase
MTDLASLQPLNVLEISKERLHQNAQTLININPKVKISPVLKSNAYGHGIELIGKELDGYNFPFYCVNSLPEAVALRNAGVKTDILIMGYVHPDNLRTTQWDFIFAAFDLEFAKLVNRYQDNPRVHLNVETGLHRDGVDFLRFEEMLTELKKLDKLQIEGLMSHMAYSNEPGSETTKKQLENFKTAKDMVKAAGINPTWFHWGGSLALLNDLASEANVVRCGKAFFGIALNISYSGDKKEEPEFMSKFNLVMKLKTQVAQVKKIQPGDTVSYSDMFRAEKPMTIGIIPTGYNDGIDRRLINKGKVLVQGKQCDYLGVIAMNVTVIDLTEVEDPKPGMEVIIYSDNATDPNTFDNSAAMCATLPQDLVLHLPKDLVRNLV